MSWSYTTTWSGEDKYQVMGHDGQFVVHKKEITGTCKKWQLIGVPHCHASPSLYFNKEKLEEYLDNRYKVTTYLETYRYILNPIKGRDYWPKSNQGPMIPLEPINKNRDQKTSHRRKEAYEEIGFTNKKVSKKGIKITCNICEFFLLNFILYCIIS